MVLNHLASAPFKRSYVSLNYSYKPSKFLYPTKLFLNRTIASAVFPGKAEQMKLVTSFIKEKSFIPQDLIDQEVNSFYNNLGIDDMYFEEEAAEQVAEHITNLYASKVQAYIRNESMPEIGFKREKDNSAVFIHTSYPGLSHPKNYEKLIDSKYLDVPSDETPFRLESYLSTGRVANSKETALRCFLVRRCEFVNSNPNESEALDINVVGDKNFLSRTSPKTHDLFQTVMKQVLKNNSPIIKIVDNNRLIIGFKRRSTRSFFSAISDVFHYYGLSTSRKYVDQFSNGVTICSFYLKKIEGHATASLSKNIQNIIEEASLIYCMPNSTLQKFVKTKEMSVQEAVYGSVGWIFAQHFLKRLGSEFTGLSNIVDMNNIAHVEVLSSIKKRLRSDTFTREYILEVIQQYPELIKLCHQHFSTIHNIHSSVPPISDDKLMSIITRTVQNQNELKIFESYVTFNNSILKTNFYKSSKVALSFRLKPSFLSEVEFPRPVFGLFLVIGAGFRGFHVRFRDIARGGIRIVKSRNRENYTINLRSLLDENYGLAATQQKKNKDIPEGGSKGTILLDLDHQDKPRVAFEKYVDSILDLLLLEDSHNQESHNIVDLYKQPEILFFGPDEGTADMMDWASQHARKRGASFWSAFTTGKSQSIGGIPHDTFGMTTRSVHQYVLGIYRKLGLDETQVTKMQIGGPDGDLGSNEILISKDKTIGIVDGSGVVYDPNGLDREELTRLAHARKMIIHFDKSKLSAKGFLVLVDDVDVTLPDGTPVQSGLAFRNQFHLNPLSSADLFVPCGGRPESIDLSNVQKLFHPDHTPRFKYIVEGSANLFLTQEARLMLEKAGVVVFKDASANKGGVTSSSLEVLAALSLNEQEFAECMQVKPSAVPKFYKSYVEVVQHIIERNADLEFEALWRENQQTKKPISILSDDLSYAIVKLNEELQHTSLWENLSLRRVVLNEALPKLLVEKVGLEELLKRIPEPYTKAIFGAYLASRFVYQYGTTPSQFAFFEYMAPYFEKVSHLENK
ncbi:Glutamate/Leucine/Phenylalanine/Valine dehydrogenase-domain-containing protein [Globomyces pollinis-pini]|nr:Glutamate/Leucine/Phenylalanine/Valine dehydrogenase-domain-containing protein [Globomyces pollinis-pini]